MKTIALGAHGEDVRDVQARLAALGYLTEPDDVGAYGRRTQAAVREFQQRRHLMADGRVGADTWQQMVEAGYSLGDRVLYLRYPFIRGDDVRELQGRLNLLGFDAGREDGIFGEAADRAIRDFQRNVGLPPDGIVGSTTLEALTRIRPIAAGPGFAEVREREAMRTLGPSRLIGARVAVDAGHGGEDPGIVGPSGLREADAVFQLAEALVEALQARGAAPFLLRPAGGDTPTSERVRAANAGGAVLLISMHLNSHADAAAEGATVFYCGREAWSSPGGFRLAELIQEELTGQLLLKDGRTHPKWLQLLRETRMPAVHVEPCFITNPAEEAALTQDGFRRAIADAVATGIERFFRDEPVDRPAGSQPARDPAARKGQPLQEPASR